MIKLFMIVIFVKFECKVYVEIRGSDEDCWCKIVIIIEVGWVVCDCGIVVMVFLVEIVFENFDFV